MEEKQVRFVPIDEVVSQVNRISANMPRTIYTLKFSRKAPKCLSCGKKSAVWKKGQDKFCPHCGGLIEYVKSANVMIRNMNADGFMYFENGSMKACIASNIISLTMPNGLEMYVVHQE